MKLTEKHCAHIFPQRQDQCPPGLGQLNRKCARKREEGSPPTHGTKEACRTCSRSRRAATRVFRARGCGEAGHEAEHARWEVPASARNGALGGRRLPSPRAVPAPSAASRECARRGLTGRRREGTRRVSEACVPSVCFMGFGTSLCPPLGTGKVRVIGALERTFPRLPSCHLQRRSERPRLGASSRPERRGLCCPRPHWGNPRPAPVPDLCPLGGREFLPCLRCR